MRPIKIRKAMNGFIVDVGCQTLVFDSVRSLVDALRQYLTEPEETEKMYVAEYGMAGAIGEDVCARDIRNGESSEPQRHYAYVATPPPSTRGRV